MSTPAIPAGYRRLKVGEKRVDGFGWWNRREQRFDFATHSTFARRVIDKSDMAIFGPYIAPVRRKGGKKGRAK